MQIVREIPAMQALADAERAARRRIGLVPTMGALHAGHLALVAEARRRADFVCVSIFVNPTQFGADEDLDAYPRSFESDADQCRAQGVDAIFAPDAAAVYPPGYQSWVAVTELAKPLCGRSRPVHFRGVATVVTKLLLATKPHLAVFGEKDFQQLALIRRLVLDLGFDVEIVGVPTVREADGLALSSRNAYLDAATRPQARCLVRALEAAERAVAAGERGRDALLQVVRGEIGKAPQAELDYAELRDPDSLEVAPETLVAPTLLALAVRFPRGEGRDGQNVRLIDNRLLLSQRRPFKEKATCSEPC
jgi:pantoate--beta-alanine ligase